MKLSILDQSPIAFGKEPQDALVESMKLAQLAEHYGYTRYWIAEHHGMKQLASSAPEVMLSYIGAHTSTLRIGSGAVLLPHYKPYKVAEIYNLLATLFPDRIDIGVGRAPGGSAEASMALSGNFLENVRNMPDKIEELLHFLNDDFPDDHFYKKTKAAPIPNIPPAVWMLGTSVKSAKLAAMKGSGYAFGLFMSDQDGKEIINTYRSHFKPGKQLSNPYSLLTLSVICANTTEEAEEIAQLTNFWWLQSSKGIELSHLPSLKELLNYSFTNEDKIEMDARKEKLIVGNPEQIKKQLTEIQQKYQVDEIMIVTITYDYKSRLRSYQLIAEEIIDRS
ncbi:LLM class flavin-dependent oxidoreductase [Radiobacillus sp. PE A8.2]|uniref:LLM class flavin-dependent oxidoreductase n=1 Tax=Radiobacillus sp. PE A8.2 TaxID=3380349 RepID=UPI00388CF377